MESNEEGDEDLEEFRNRAVKYSRQVFQNYKNLLDYERNPFSTCLSRKLNIKLLKLVSSTHEVMIHISGCKGKTASYLMSCLVEYYPKHLFVYRSFNKVKIMIDKYSMMALANKDSEWISLNLYPDSIGMVSSIIQGFIKMVASLPIEKYGRMIVDCQIHHKISSIIMLTMSNKYIDLASFLDSEKDIEYKCTKRPFLGACVRMGTQNRFGFDTMCIFEKGRINFLNANMKSVIQNLNRFLMYLEPHCTDADKMTAVKRNLLRSNIRLTNHDEPGSLGAGIQHMKKSDMVAARKAEVKRILSSKKIKKKKQKQQKQPHTQDHTEITAATEKEEAEEETTSTKEMSMEEIAELELYKLLGLC